MSACNEERAVITLQIGNYSNYVGAHFWNIQEAGFVYPSANSINYVPDINNIVLFREGVTGYSKSEGQPTYTPRLVSVDLKGSLGRYIQNFHTLLLVANECHMHRGDLLAMKNS